VLLPEPGREEFDLGGRVGLHTLKHIDEVDVGVQPLESARAEQALEDSGALGADLGSAKEAVLSSESYDTKFAFEVIGVHGDVRVFEEDPKPCPSLQRVARRLRERIGRKQDALAECALQPLEELVDQRLAGKRSSNGVLPPLPRMR
jgi:hypothetical protein